MEKEIKKCQNCKQNFVIEPEDFEFYKKIEVPAPTWCPECRATRRFSFRNARVLYKRKVVGMEKDVFSGISPDSPLIVYDQRHWWGDSWDAMEYGREYNFSRPFFTQLNELIREVPWPHGYNVNSINSEYCNNVDGLKNCYLLFNAGWSESSYYGSDILRSNNCMDVTRVDGCELSYELLDCEKCHKCFFSQECVECSDVYFSHNLVNCSNCFGCVNLKHKKFCIFNKQYSENEYRKQISKFDTGSFRSISGYGSELKKLIFSSPHKYMRGQNNTNVTGDYIDHSKNTKNSFICRGLEDCAHCQLILFMDSRDCYDMNVAGGEMCYEIEEAGGYGIKFCWLALPKNLKGGQINLTSLEYSMDVFNSSHLFGCVGVHNKQYCILNKQYTKENYEKLVPRIIEHMNAMPYVDKKGRVYKYGEFFPPEFSPFAYNETIAQEYFPISKEQAEAQGYRWKELGTKDYKISKKPEELLDHIKDVDDSILEETIGCAHQSECNEQCTTAFKIIKDELAFYKRMNLPIPRLCPNCRHYQRLRQRNLFKLWHRRCMCDYQVYKNTIKHNHHPEGGCPNEFETTYSPDRKEIVYCEACYNAEVA